MIIQSKKLCRCWCKPCQILHSQRFGEGGKKGEKFTMKKIYDFVKQHPIKALLIAFLPYIIAIIVYFVNFVICNGFSLSSNIEHWGQAGDFFGGMLNPVYSFFALILLWFTLLDNQKKSEIEKFENNFFNMLDMLKSLLKDLREEPKENTPDSILSEFIERGDFFFSIEGSIKSGADINPLGAKFPDDYGLTVGMKETPLLDNIFRLLYQILKYIYEKHPSEKGDSNIYERENYSDIVRSFLPEILFWLLAVNASIYKKDPYKKNLEYYHELIEKFAFLEDMKLENLELVGKIKLYYVIFFNYDIKAFGDLKNVKYTIKLLSDENEGEDLLGSKKFEKLWSRIYGTASAQSQEK